MKRDMDLVRTILLELEKSPYQRGFLEIRVPGYSDDGISYHVQLMSEAGLIEATDVSTLQNICWMPKRITFEGHEFLDAAREDTLWAKAKESVISTTGTLTLEALKVALQALIRRAVVGT